LRTSWKNNRLIPGTCAPLAALAGGAFFMFRLEQVRTNDDTTGASKHYSERRLVMIAHYLTACVVSLCSALMFSYAFYVIFVDKEDM